MRLALNMLMSVCASLMSYDTAEPTNRSREECGGSGQASSMSVCEIIVVSRLEA